MPAFSISMFAMSRGPEMALLTGYHDGERRKKMRWIVTDPDEYFEQHLYSITVEMNPLFDRYQVYRVTFNPDEYVDANDLGLGRYLMTLQKPEGMSDGDYAQLRKKAKNFMVRDGLLFKRSRRGGIPPGGVVGLSEERTKIMRELYDEKGHLGQKATYNQIARRYQWRGMYQDVAEWVKTCDECQKIGKLRFEEPLHPTWTMTVWQKVGLDVVRVRRSCTG
jgi:Integrase zinc binding domain